MTAATATPPATAAATSPPASGADEQDAGRGWGIVLDVAGVIAGLIVVFVVADIWTGGKLSAPFRRREITDDSDN